MGWEDWNELVDSSNRFETTKKSSRSASITKPTHIVIHITGTDNFTSVKNRFLSDNASAHYCVKPDSTITQFVRDKDAAWHAGIVSYVAALYNKNDDSWKKYVRYFNWSSYPGEVKYLKEDLTETTVESEKKLVAKKDGTNWGYYSYWSRHGSRKIPIMYDVNKSPNAYSIGIELLTTGSTDKSKYAEGLYTGLIKLLDNLCTKYDILRDRDHIIGHEDVNPVERWGWDPNSGFDWDRIIAGINGNGNFPVKLKDTIKCTDTTITDYYKHIEKEIEGGYYPVGINMLWHGGIHINATEGSEVYACLDGKIIAARLAEDETAANGPMGHRNFILVQHKIKDKPVYSLYMHLKNSPLSDSDETVKKCKWLVCKTPAGKYKVKVDILNCRSEPKVANGNIVGQVKRGDTLAVIEDFSSTWKKVKTPAGLTAYVNCDTTYCEVIVSEQPDKDLLVKFKTGGVVKIDKDVKSGDFLWVSGKYGSKTSQSGLIHWEIFSPENVVKDDTTNGWVCCEDSIDDFNADSDQVKTILGDILSDNVVTKEELKNLYANNPDGKAEKFRKLACKFITEWGIADLSTAIDNLKKKGMVAKKEDIEPYLWWQEAVTAGVSLPSTQVWHYNPVRFLEIFGKTSAPAQPLTPPVTPPITPPTPVTPTPAQKKTVLVSKCSGPDSATPGETIICKVTEFSNPATEDDKKRVSWCVKSGGTVLQDTKNAGVEFKFQIQEKFLGEHLTFHPYMNSPSDSTCVHVTVGPLLLFNGTTLVMFDKKFNKVKSWNAVSGLPGFQTAEHQSLKDKGPIPEGLWYVKLKDLQHKADQSVVDWVIGGVDHGEWPGGEERWGKHRVWINPLPGTNTLGRSGFCIHGGTIAGSAGCIDLTTNMDSFNDFLISNNKDIILKVKYGAITIQPVPAQPQTPPVQPSQPVTPPKPQPSNPSTPNPAPATSGKTYTYTGRNGTSVTETWEITDEEFVDSSALTQEQITAICNSHNPELVKRGFDIGIYNFSVKEGINPKVLLATLAGEQAWCKNGRYDKAFGVGPGGNPQSFGADAGMPKAVKIYLKFYKEGLEQIKTSGSTKKMLINHDCKANGYSETKAVVGKDNLESWQAKNPTYTAFMEKGTWIQPVNASMYSKLRYTPWTDFPPQNSYPLKTWHKLYKSL